MPVKIFFCYARENVKRLLDEETQRALEKINQGMQISQEQIKSIGNKTRKITQRLEEDPS